MLTIDVNVQNGFHNRSRRTAVPHTMFQTESPTQSASFLPQVFINLSLSLLKGLNATLDNFLQSQTQVPHHMRASIPNLTSNLANPTHSDEAIHQVSADTEASPVTPSRRPFTIENYTTEAERFALKYPDLFPSNTNTALHCSLELPLLSPKEQAELEDDLLDGHRFVAQGSVEGEFLYEPAIKEYWSREPEVENVVAGLPWRVILFIMIFALALMLSLSDQPEETQTGGVYFDEDDLNGSTNATVTDGVVEKGAYVDGKLVGSDRLAQTEIEVDRHGIPRVTDGKKGKKRESNKVFKEYRETYDKNFPDVQHPVVVVIG